MVLAQKGPALSVPALREHLDAVADYHDRDPLEVRHRFDKAGFRIHHDGIRTLHGAHPAACDLPAHAEPLPPRPWSPGEQWWRFR